MRKFYKTIFLFLTFSLLQFFAPVLNVAMELACCEEQMVTPRRMQCCQAEFPSRLVCCAGNVEHGLDNSVPLKATLQKTVHIPLGLTVSVQSIAFDQTSPLAVITFTEIALLNSHFFGNKLYKQLATYLI